MRKLSISGVQLLDLIDSSNAFVDKLGAVGCITWSQREHIINIVQPRDRNELLLEFLTRRSVADFKKFINVLDQEQAHLVPLLGELMSYLSINLNKFLKIICEVSITNNVLHKSYVYVIY